MSQRGSSWPPWSRAGNTFRLDKLGTQPSCRGRWHSTQSHPSMGAARLRLACRTNQEHMASTMSHLSRAGVCPRRTACTHPVLPGWHMCRARTRQAHDHHPRSRILMDKGSNVTSRLWTSCLRTSPAHKLARASSWHRLDKSHPDHTTCSPLRCANPGTCHCRTRCMWWMMGSVQNFLGCMETEPSRPRHKRIREGRWSIAARSQAE